MPEQSGSTRELALKPRDSWWTVIAIDPITIRLLPALLRLPGVTPMRVTAVGFLVGVVSVTSFALGWLAAGAILFQLRYVIDCLDGKVARARGIASPWGAFVDLAVDVAVVGSAYAALGVWAWREGVDGSWFALVLLPAFAVAAWLHLYRRLALGEDERTSRARQPATRAWAWSRFRPYPASVEVETTLLVFFPLLLPVDWFPYIAGAATAFYVVSGLDSARRVRSRLSQQTPLPDER